MLNTLRFLIIVLMYGFSCFGYAMELDNSSFSCAELKEILPSFLADEVIEYKPALWKNINSFRELVQSSLNEGISSIVESHYTSGPIIEIGAGAAYNLRDNINENIIRLQPNRYDFHELVQAKIKNIYPIDIAQFSKALPNTKKYIPLYFAVNVFDTMSPEEKLSNLSTIATTQQPGGKIVIISDTNPWLSSIITEMNAEYSDMIVLPYLPSNCDDKQAYKASAILIPQTLLLGNEQIDPKLYYELWMNEITLRSKQYISTTQKQLEEMQKEYHLNVIALEDYYAQKITAILKRVGYEVRSYYHTSFSLMNKKEITQPIIYKHVTESLATVRQWSHKDENLEYRLKDKNIFLPDCYDDKFFEDLLNGDQRLTGAELLVIAAQKTYTKNAI